jgi:hypothetical protein
MVVAAVRVRLPDLDHCVGYWHPVAVDDAPLNTYALAGSFRLGQHISARILA